MATIFVWSGGSNTSPYNSFATAATTMATGITVAAAGDTFKVADDHSESTAASLTLSFPGTDNNPNIVLCVNRGTGLLSTGASIATAGGAFNLTPNGGIYCYGVNWSCAGSLNVNGTTHVQRYEQCTFALTGSAATLNVNAQSAALSFFRNCNFDMSGTSSSSAAIRASGEAWLIGGTYTTRAAGQAALFGGNLTGQLVVEGMALGNASSVFVLGSISGRVTIRRCKLGTYTSLTSSTPVIGTEAYIEACTVGTGITVPPLGLTRADTYYGTVASDSSRWRTGGATDGSTPISWSLASNANTDAFYAPLRTQPLTQWVAGGSSITFTIYVASGASLDNSQFWIELEGPDNTASPNTSSQGFLATTRAAPLSTPVALTTDSVSVWNGTGVGTVQKVSITYTPAVAGPVSIRACLGETSTTVYIDAEIDDGAAHSRVYFVEGTGVAEISSGGGGGGLLTHPGMQGGCRG